jgi:hypothetical protein
LHFKHSLLDMDPTDPIRRVSAVSTGQVQIHPDLVILPAHDPAAASGLAQATGQVPTLTTA